LRLRSLKKRHHARTGRHAAHLRQPRSRRGIEPLAGFIFGELRSRQSNFEPAGDQQLGQQQRAIRIAPHFIHQNAARAAQGAGIRHKPRVAAHPDVKLFRIAPRQLDHGVGIEALAMQAR